MATRKKYKIVLSEKYVRKSENGKEWFQFPVNISGQLVAIQTIILLDPYTEPDLEQVRKEAYEQGLSDAWEAARKVTQVRKYGGYGDCLEEVFGRHRVPWDVFDYSAPEAIEKIRQYEQEKDRQARIEYNFDEIKDVLETTAKECNVSLDEIAEVLQKMKESE